MIRQAAFEGGKKLLKGALHTHTTRSDGESAPEELLKLYKEANFDFVAITDHRIYNLQSFGPETGLLIIPGMEFDASIQSTLKGIHCFHTIVLGRGKEDNPFEQDQQFDTKTVKDQYEYQKMLDYFHENGQITFYCHPEWSNTPANEFEELKGNFGMEIWNSGCALGLGIDTDASYWDDLLRSGKKLYGCATDDCHSPESQRFGWVCVNAEKDIDSVLDALQNGAFYSSCGPVIKDFYIHDGVAVVECSPCSEVVFRNGQYHCLRSVSETNDLTHVEVKIQPYLNYLRVSVKDGQGRKAWSNPIFFD